MNHAEVVATYSETVLTEIIRQLTASGEWPTRLKAAKDELKHRKSHELQQDKESIL